ncbi:MAG: hypothetical protein R3C46_07095 [Hyphomonadaceae bacterium]
MVDIWKPDWPRANEEEGEGEVSIEFPNIMAATPMMLSIVENTKVEPWKPWRSDR